MTRAAETANLDLPERLLSESHDVNWRDDAGRTALAAANGHERVVRTLIKAGAEA